MPVPNFLSVTSKKHNSFSVKRKWQENLPPFCPFIVKGGFSRCNKLYERHKVWVIGSCWVIVTNLSLNLKKVSSHIRKSIRKSTQDEALANFLKILGLISFSKSNIISLFDFVVHPSSFTDIIFTNLGPFDD